MVYLCSLLPPWASSEWLFWICCEAINSWISISLRPVGGLLYSFVESCFSNSLALKKFCSFEEIVTSSRLYRLTSVRDNFHLQVGTPADENLACYYPRSSGTRSQVHRCVMGLGLVEHDVYLVQVTGSTALTTMWYLSRAVGWRTSTVASMAVKILSSPSRSSS